MPGRTVSRWTRFYMDGYDMSGYARSVGALQWKFDEADLTALSDSAKGYLPVLADMGPASVDANFDTTATVGLHAVASAAGVSRICMFPIGIATEPAQGDWAFCGRYQQAGYTAAQNGGAMTVNMAFEGWDAAYATGYDIPWGQVLKAKGAAVTAANTAIGVESVTGAATAFGGYLLYQVFTGSTGLATITVEKSTTTNLNASFSYLDPATTVELNLATPQAGIIALPKTTSVGRYLRWQLTPNGAISAIFALAFVRAFHS
jgi:hypothetical protein